MTKRQQLQGGLMYDAWMPSGFEDPVVIFFGGEVVPSGYDKIAMENHHV